MMPSTVTEPGATCPQNNDANNNGDDDDDDDNINIRSYWFSRE
jgi:hypothetical protein